MIYMILSAIIPIYIISLTLNTLNISKQKGHAYLLPITSSSFANIYLAVDIPGTFSSFSIFYDFRVSLYMHT